MRGGRVCATIVIAFVNVAGRAWRRGTGVNGKGARCLRRCLDDGGSVQRNCVYMFMMGDAEVLGYIAQDNSRNMSTYLYIYTITLDRSTSNV